MNTPVDFVTGSVDTKKNEDERSALHHMSVCALNESGRQEF
jgi:hypothetical protein